jgi:hypothetical protein
MFCNKIRLQSRNNTSSSSSSEETSSPNKSIEETFLLLAVGFSSSSSWRSWNHIFSLRLSQLNLLVLRPVYTKAIFAVIIFFWWIWMHGWVMKVQMRIHILLRTFITHLLSQMHQTKIAPKVAAKFARLSVNRTFDTIHVMM